MQVLRTAYLLRQRTPAELVPVPAEWQPLPQGPTYTDFKDFPQSGSFVACRPSRYSYNLLCPSLLCVEILPMVRAWSSYTPHGSACAMIHVDMH